MIVVKHNAAVAAVSVDNSASRHGGQRAHAVQIEAVRLRSCNLVPHDLITIGTVAIVIGAGAGHPRRHNARRLIERGRHDVLLRRVPAQVLHARKVDGGHQRRAPRAVARLVRGRQRQCGRRIR